MQALGMGLASRKTRYHLVDWVMKAAFGVGEFRLAVYEMVSESLMEGGVLRRLQVESWELKVVRKTGGLRWPRCEFSTKSMMMPTASAGEITSTVTEVLLV